jgi:hypothetical protein
MRQDRELERELERELGELGSRIEYPPTPDLARAVRRRLEEGDRTPRRAGFGLPTLPARWAAAAALLLFLAVPVLSPATRETFSGPFVAGPAAEGGKPQSAAVESGDAAPSPSSPERAVPIGAGMGLGEPITLREARRRGREGAPVLWPEAKKLGEPDGVYALGPPGEGGVALVYRSRPGLPPLGDTSIGLVLTELTGDLESTYLEEAGSVTGFEEVSVGGGRGYWISDGRYLAPPGGRTWRPRAGVLLWEREGRALRLEADLQKKEAIRIAESTR